jgi:hypothetical protein
MFLAAVGAGNVTRKQLPPPATGTYSSNAWLASAHLACQIQAESVPNSCVVKKGSKICAATLGDSRSAVENFDQWRTLVTRQSGDNGHTGWFIGQSPVAQCVLDEVQTTCCNCWGSASASTWRGWVDCAQR